MRCLSFVSALLIGLAVLIGRATPAATEPYISDGDVPAFPPVTQKVLAAGLVHPWGIAFLPDGSFLVTERPGRLRLITSAGVVEPPLQGVPDVFAAGQGGLMDVALDPEFETSKLVYLTYSDGNRRFNGVKALRARIDGLRLTDVEEIFAVSQLKPGGQHFGSRLLFLPDGTLLISIGDGGNPPVELFGKLVRLYAQDLDSHIGKIVRINPDGSIPNDNPFRADPNAEAAVYSIGHRNIQGIDHDPVTGKIWVNEHGALRGDELNLIEAGQNYGWPAVTFSRDYRGATEISPHTTLPGMRDPVLAWMQTQAPSGLAIYRHPAVPEWDGLIFSGGLVSQQVRAIALGPNDEILSERAIDIGARVRDVRVGPDGALYVLTDEPLGRLIRITPAS